MCVCVCVNLCVCMPLMYLLRSEDNCVELVLSSHLYTGFRDGTQVGHRACLYPLSYLAGLCVCVVFES